MNIKTIKEIVTKFYRELTNDNGYKFNLNNMLTSKNADKNLIYHIIPGKDLTFLLHYPADESNPESNYEITSTSMKGISEIQQISFFDMMPESKMFIYFNNIE